MAKKKQPATAVPVDAHETEQEIRTLLKGGAA
jgi:hypothetical protein